MSEGQELTKDQHEELERLRRQAALAQVKEERKAQLEEGTVKSALQRSADEVDAFAQSVGEQGEISLSTGVKIKAIKMPPGLMSRLHTRYRETEPKIPMLEQTDPETGKPFQIENPDDEDYVEVKRQHDYQMGIRMRDAMLAYGVEVVSVPPDLYPIDDDTWLEALEIIGDPLPKTPTSRKLAWFDAVAIRDSDDYEKIGNLVTASMNVKEEDVQEAMDSFPGQS